MRRWAAPLGILAIGSGLGSCRQIVGISDHPPEELTTTVCGLPYGTSACASCAQTSCCDQSAACAASSSCDAFEGCFGECSGDPTCWARCMANYPATGAEVSALSACMASHCDGECGLACGAFAGAPVSSGTAPACQACLKSMGCSATLACAQDVECDENNRCQAACATYDCVIGCELSHGVNPEFNIVPDAGNGGVWGRLNNARYQCMPACADWNCVGSVAWPRVSVATPYTFHFWVEDRVTPSKFLPDVNIAVCGVNDPQCMHPFDTGVTNATGGVTLQFTNESSISEGLDGYVKVTAPGLTDNYFYWGSPLSESQVYLGTQITTAAEYQEESTFLGIDPNLSRGWLAVLVFDCANDEVPDVPVVISPEDGLTQGFTTSGARTTKTDETGLILFGAVMPGRVQISVTPPGPKGPISTTVVEVYAGSTTVAFIRPTP